MPQIDKHVETMFSYSDLQTTDLEAAKTFYTKLFGWSVDEQPMGEGQVYAMFKKDGKTTGAASLQQPQQRDMGVPPMWTTYFTVYDVDSRTKEAERAGGTIHAEPFDVFDAGRMSVIQDPNGAVFALWQPKENIGAEVMNEPNTLTWTECAARDTDKGRAFYTEVFGWTYEEMDMGDGNKYTLFKKDGVESPVCGLMPLQMEGMPSFWLIYFSVESCDDTAAKAKELGADIKNPPTDIPNVGRFAIIADPQGATFGVLQPDLTAQTQG
jgi:predicted enzyme related to lactoylglutathione lyase